MYNIATTYNWIVSENLKDFVTKVSYSYANNLEQTDIASVFRFQQKLSIGYWGCQIVGQSEIRRDFKHISHISKSKYGTTDKRVKINDKLNIWDIFLEDSKIVVVITEDEYTKHWLFKLKFEIFF